MIGKTVPNPLVRVCGDDPYNGERAGVATPLPGMRCLLLAHRRMLGCESEARALSQGGRATVKIGARHEHLYDSSVVK
jgi:hypothetical protein